MGGRQYCGSVSSAECVCVIPRNATTKIVLVLDLSLVWPQTLQVIERLVPSGLQHSARRGALLTPFTGWSLPPPFSSGVRPVFWTDALSDLLQGWSQLGPDWPRLVANLGLLLLVVIYGRHRPSSADFRRRPSGSELRREGDACRTVRGSCIQRTATHA